MPSDEARALASALLANYPGSYISEMNVLAIADSLDRIGLNTAAEVVDRARTEILRVPSVAQLYQLATEVREEAVAAEVPPMLPPGEVLTSMPNDVREAVMRMHERWAENVERTLEEEDAEWQRVKATTLARPRLRGVCNGAGKPVVEIDGKRVCPDCGVEVPDLIVRLPKKQRPDVAREATA